MTAHEAASYARGQGVDMIITDHHELGASLPDATAIINPKLLESRTHPLADLPGVGVAYKLAEALYERARRPSDAARHLDLVALGIVADLAVLRGDTRYLLQRGLTALRGTVRPGLVALMEKAELDPTWLSEEHIGFVLGPRLNAAGRLADANVCVDLLTTGDIGRARILAADLEALNARRKLLCNQVEGGAEAQIARDPSLLEGGALVLANPAWPAGIIGIVASRLVERYGKPTILIASPPGEVARASARSVAGVNITAALTVHASLLVNFGGHPMAAGFGIDPERIPELRRALSRTVAGMLAEAHVEIGLRIDGFLRLAELTPALADDLGRLAPFGPGNPPLTLAAERLRARPGKKVGRNAEHQLVIVTDEAGGERQVIWWDGGSEPLPEGRFDLAYVARNSTYRGTRELQVEWVEARLCAEAEVEVKAKVKAEVEVEDYRDAPQPREVLAGLVERGEVAVWREGEDARDIPGYDRWNLPQMATLVIWTAPPGPAELRAVLAQVRPVRVCLFGRDPGADTAEAFVRRLTGLVKHALSARGGCAPVAQLAAATAQREATVRLGLAWLAARGHIRIVEETNGEVQLAAGDGLAAPEAEIKALDARLRAALAETAAYRSYFREADAAALVRR